jgi:hypothetical protein
MGARFVLSLMMATVPVWYGNPCDAASQPAEGTPAADRLMVGAWTANVAKSKPGEGYAFKAADLRIERSGDSMTMSSRLVFASGDEQRATETFRTDGAETRGTLTPGVTLVARWLDPHVLASLARKDGRVVAVVIYEVSADGSTLTLRTSGAVEQTLVFERSR